MAASLPTLASGAAQPSPSFSPSSRSSAGRSASRDLSFAFLRLPQGGIMTARPHVISPSLGTVRAVLVYRSLTDNSLSRVGLGVTASCTAKALRANGIWADVWGVPTPDALLERLRQTEGDALTRGQI